MPKHVRIISYFAFIAITFRVSLELLKDRILNLDQVVVLIVLALLTPLILAKLQGKDDGNDGGDSGNTKGVCTAGGRFSDRSCGLKAENRLFPPRFDCKVRENVS